MEKIQECVHLLIQSEGSIYIVILTWINLSAKYQDIQDPLLGTMYRLICRQVDENESEDVDTEEDRKDMERIGRRV